MMDDKIIFKILSDHINGLDTVLPDGTDLKALSDLAREQQVEGIVYKQCGSPDEGSLSEAYAAAVYYFANRTRTVEKIKEALSCGGVANFTIKGLNIAKYYPVPALRTMGDCDFIVEPENVEKAVEILRNIGFEVKPYNGHHSWVFEGSGLHIELHDQLVKEDVITDGKIIAFFNDFMPYVKDNALDGSFHFLYVMIHLMKHLSDTGAGVRQFLDLAVLIKNCRDIDWAWVKEKTGELGIEKFCAVCFTAVEEWFSVSAPVAFERQSGETVEELASHLLKGGIFGFLDKKSMDVYMWNYQNEGKGPLWLRRVIMISNEVFLGYGRMKRYPGITYLDGRPWLLPVAWIHRFVILLKRKDKSQSVETFKLNTIPKKDLESPREFLKKIGIDKA